jgi:hypothetical protein
LPLLELIEIVPEAIVLFRVAAVVRDVAGPGGLGV